MNTPLLTLADVFFHMVDHNLLDTMNYRVDGSWHAISALEVYRHTVNVAHVLQSWGFQRGDRAAILSENRPEWQIADFATLLLGGVDVPIYPTLTPEQTAYILKDSGSKVVILSTAEQFQKVQPMLKQLQVEKIVVMDEVDAIGANSMNAMMTGAPYFRDAALETYARLIKPDDLATIIYTSGTTGTSKGVMLTHGNIASNLEAGTNTFEWSRERGYISFLPLSHITARHVDYIMLATGIGVSYCPSFDELSAVIQEIRPATFIAVPRVYEKIRQEVERHSASGVKHWFFEWAMRVGREHREEIVAGQHPRSLSWHIADRLVFSKVRGALGGRAQGCISGGAPLGRELAEWYADAGIRIFEGYGLTETSPVIAINTGHHIKLGSVGQPLPNVECRLAEDGELLVRAPSVTKGYWNLPQETAVAFVDGWFRTGDIARFDSDGYLYITDRKKDLIKTSGGKFIAPQPIENSLKTNVLIAHAAIIGDKRKYPAVLIAPHFPLLEDWAQVNSVPFASRHELIQHPRVRALYEGIVADLNKKLASFERLKRIILVPDEFEVGSGELTASFKLKRREVEKKYADLIEALYAEPYHPEREASETH